MASGSFRVLRLMWPLITSRHKCCRGRGLPGDTQTNKNAHGSTSWRFRSNTTEWIWSFTQYVRNLLPLWSALQDAFEVRTDADVADVVQEQPYDTADQMCQPRHRYELAELKDRKSRMWFVVELLVHWLDSSFLTDSTVDVRELTVMTLGWLYIR